MHDEKSIKLVYDRQCPVCDFYCQRIDIVGSAGNLVRIDARVRSEIMDEITAIGLDIDAGMVLKVGDNFYYGSDAIHTLATMSSRKGAINHLAYWLFRSQKIAHMLYPIMAACRNVLLKILGRTRINNLRTENNERF